MVRLLSLSELVDPRENIFGPAEPTAVTVGGDNDGASNPNLNAFSAALFCYPIASQLARYLDQNSLHELSRTCRQIRAQLLQNRSLLIAQTLRCEDEETHSAQRYVVQGRPRDVWMSVDGSGASMACIVPGKPQTCARDFVGECRRCNRVVCRNCVIKTPLPHNLRLRHRRLCQACLKAPIEELSRVSTRWYESGDDENSWKNNPSLHSTIRSSCSCHEGTWICRVCGLASYASDTTYIRGWKWRNRYSTCGGFGAGLGEGNEGVECGRGADCLAARMVEKEAECDATELAALDQEKAKASQDGRHWQGSSYATQEVVGIGGKVVQKVRKLVRVGAIVKEYEDERITEQFLGREHEGAKRSWCSWCERVIKSCDDLVLNRIPD